MPRRMLPTEPDAFATVVLRLRTQRKLSPSEVDRRIGLRTRNHCSQVEEGAPGFRYPTRETVSRYSDALCTTDDEHAELCRAAGYDPRSIGRRLPDHLRDRRQYPLTWQQALVLVSVRGPYAPYVIGRIMQAAQQFHYNASVGAVFGDCDVVAWLRPGRDGVQQHRIRGQIPQRHEAVIDLVDWLHGDSKAQRFIRSTETLIIRDDLAGIDCWPNRTYRAHAVVLLTGTFGYSRSVLLDKIVNTTDGWRGGSSGKGLQAVEVLGLAVLVGRYDIALHLGCNASYPLEQLQQAVTEIAEIRIGTMDVAPAVRTATLIGVSDREMWKNHIEVERLYTKRETAPRRGQ